MYIKRLLGTTPTPGGLLSLGRVVICHSGKCDTRQANQMNKTRMLSFRLDASQLRRIDMLAASRHRPRGQIIREALDMYFKVHTADAMQNPK